MSAPAHRSVAHTQARKHWAAVLAGPVPVYCPFCHLPVRPDRPWDLDHETPVAGAAPPGRPDPPTPDATAPTAAESEPGTAPPPRETGDHDRTDRRDCGVLIPNRRGRSAVARRRASGRYGQQFDLES